jgi:hypothetical protein
MKRTTFPEGSPDQIVSDHLANRFSVAEGGMSTSPQPKNHARHPPTVARGIRLPRAAQLHASAAFAEPVQAVATAARRAAAGSDRLQRHAAAVAR